MVASALAPSCCPGPQRRRHYTPSSAPTPSRPTTSPPPSPPYPPRSPATTPNPSASTPSLPPSTRTSPASRPTAVLAAHHAGCTSLLSPIRRLPFVEIFALCSAEFTPTFTDGPALGLFPLQIAFMRLAHGPRRALSRVCTRWHGVAMGTPALWTRLDLDTVLWRTPAFTRTATVLLVGALERGGNSLLTVELTLDEHFPPTPALALLTAHSARWQALSVTCDGAWG
ncbi:hypothetical protein C8R44DRAFT_932753 [Mycena epipterygia]|nr:hypothetical protein C8R44DRAFT_932753 [Mycena epipterygia]